MTNYTIDIVSDTVCPWCYVGKRRLDAAISAHTARNPQDTFTMTWHPFQLNPDSTTGVDKRAYYEQKFGAQRTQVMQGHLSRMGKQVGIDFAFGGKTGNTLDSHRLIALAKSKGGEEMQNRIVQELFESYFEKNEDISSPATLLERGVHAGLPESETRAYLASSQGKAEVGKELAQAREKFIAGVPHFTINGRFAVEGAEEPAAFLRVFQSVKNAEQGAEEQKQFDEVVLDGGVKC